MAEQKNPVKKKVEFLSEFLKKGRKVGSVTPSSRFLVKKMVDPIDWEHSNCIIELGPGNGVITREILKKMRKDGKLLAFEINESFCEDLRAIGDERLIVINDSAEKLAEYLEKYQIAKADHVVSSLPFAIIPRETEYSIMRAIAKVLSRKGVYTQFQYSLASYRKLKGIFKSVKLNFTPYNIPPAFVFTCRNA